LDCKDTIFSAKT